MIPSVRRMMIHAYVRIRKEVQNGMTTSVSIVFFKFGLIFKEMKYAIG